MDDVESQLVMKATALEFCLVEIDIIDGPCRGLATGVSIVARATLSSKLSLTVPH